jgi:hypothetical protein
VICITLIDYLDLKPPLEGFVVKSILLLSTGLSDLSDIAVSESLTFTGT